MSLLVSLSLAVMCASAPARADGSPSAGRTDVEVAAHLAGSVGLGAAAGAPAVGVGGSAGIPFGPVQVEVTLDGGADLHPTPRISALVGVRVPIAGTGVAPRGLAFTGGIGTGWWVDAPRPLARLGLAYDAPSRSARALRLSLAWQYGGGGAGALLGGVGLAWGIAPRPNAVVETAPPEVPSPSPSQPPLVIHPPDAMVWVPHPICEWVPASELASVLPVDYVRVGINLQVRAPGYLPVDVTLDGTASRALSLSPAPAYGTVIVVGAPGDRLTIAGKDFPMAPDGTAIFGAPEGPMAVEILGGGRRAVIDGAVAGGYALWLRAPAPEPFTVTFPPGSSVIPAAAEPALRAYVAALGDHHVRIVGSYAAEELDAASANRRLASERAEVLAQALVAAGAPPTALKVLSSARAAKDAAGEAWRYARVETLSAAEER